jgi:hypothetical protein
MTAMFSLLFAKLENHAGRFNWELPLLQLVVVLGLITSILLLFIAVIDAVLHAMRSDTPFFPALSSRLGQSTYLANLFIVLGFIFMGGYPLIQLSFYVVDGIGMGWQFVASMLVGLGFVGAGAKVQRNNQTASVPSHRRLL